LGFPEGDNFDWSYAEFSARYGRDVIEKEAKPLVLANAEQIAEMQRLLEVVKVSEDWQEKVFKKAGVDEWSEMDADKLDAIIAMLKQRITP
jgi:hypothetical protein